MATRGKKPASERLEAFFLGILAGAGLVLTIMSYYIYSLAQRFPIIFGRSTEQPLIAIPIGAAVLALAIAYELYTQGKLRASEQRIP